MVIADNSEDGAGGVLARERFPWVRAAEFGENLGFGTALNRAVARASRATRSSSSTTTSRSSPGSSTA